MSDKIFGKENLFTENFNGTKVLTGAGLFIVSASIFIWGLYIFLSIGDINFLWRLIFLSVIIGAVGFIDDVCGDGSYRGFRGHFKALLQGEITSGFLKVIISFIAVLLVVLPENQDFLSHGIDIVLILSVINLFNLFDLRPGRALKVFILLSLIFVFSYQIVQLYFVPLFIIILMYLPFEMGEKVMLGDTGSNFLGAVFGLSITYVTGIYLKFLVVVVCVFLNLLAEKYSFSKFIVRNKFLSRLDKLGR